VTNQIIKQALNPYPDVLVIVSKVGFRRGTDKSWLHAGSRQELIDAVHDNLRNLGLDTLDLVNLSRSRHIDNLAPTESWSDRGQKCFHDMRIVGNS
jgi:aryl-alcohol dehydrogenase-like predicted oxidoreductase